MIGKRKKQPLRIVLWVLGFLVCAGFEGENQYMPEYPGKATVTVEPISVRHKITAAESADFRRNLEQLRDLIVAFPIFHPTHGVEVRGYMRAEYEAPASPKTPIVGIGYIKYYPFLQGKNRIVPIIATTAEIRVHVNSLTGSLDPAGIKDADFFCQPERAGEQNGFPAYRTEKGDEFLVLSKSDKDLWIPVTREEFINAWLRIWQKENAKNPQAMFSEMVDRHKAALAAMPAEERRMQAYYFPQAPDPMGPLLSPAGSTIGTPMVKANPAWFDPSKPRSAFQVITLRFHYSGEIDPDNPRAKPEHNDYCYFRVWETLHTSNWATVASMLNR
jgi:hypothetical protein